MMSKVQTCKKKISHIFCLKKKHNKLLEENSQNFFEERSHQILKKFSFLKSEKNHEGVARQIHKSVLD